MSPLLRASTSCAIWWGHRSGGELAVEKDAQTFGRESDQLVVVDGSSIDAVVDGDVRYPGAAQHLPDRQVTLLNHGQLLQHHKIRAVTRVSARWAPSTTPLYRRGRSPIGTEPGGRGIGIDRRGSGSCCLQTWTM